VLLVQQGRTAIDLLPRLKAEDSCGLTIMVVASTPEDERDLGVEGCG
jgi:hypothetical protein